MNIRHDFIISFAYYKGNTCPLWEMQKDLKVKKILNNIVFNCLFILSLHVCVI